jgi:hypothetical protein
MTGFLHYRRLQIRLAGKDRRVMKVIEGRTVFEFSSLDAAKDFALRCIKPVQILLGGIGWPRLQMLHG